MLYYVDKRNTLFCA